MSQNLKFIHLANTAAASEGSYDKGAIIFEPKSGRIAVKGNSGLEYYGGGRIADATFENSILTISFNDGTTPAITLDFSDVASTSGVNKILGKLRTDLNALADKVGDDSKGLVKKINDNTSNISANKGEIDANKAAIAAINHETTGILAQAKKYTDGKVGDIAEGTTVKKYVDDAKADAKSYADGLAKNYDAAGAAAQALKDANAYTDTATNALDGRVTTLDGKVGGLETTVGNEGSGLVKKVNDNATAITALQGLHKDKVGEAGKMTVEQEVTAGVNAKVGEIKLNDAAVTVKEYVDAGDAKALADAKAYTDTATNALGTRVTTLETKVGSSTDAAKADGSVYARIAKNAADIATLVGTDAAKSVRTIANEELVKQLIPEGAKESLDTLQEIAAWIQNHPDDASKMNAAIDALKKTVGDDSKGLVKGVADNATAITALRGLHVDGKKVADEVTDGINKIAEASVSAGTDVVVTVKTKSGSVSAVEVNASGLRNDLGEKTAAAGTDTAFGRIKTLETAVGKPANGEVVATGLYKAIADETVRATGVEGKLRTDVDANADAIKVLRDAQTSGSLMWSVWQEN